MTSVPSNVTGANNDVDLQHRTPSPEQSHGTSEKTENKDGVYQTEEDPYVREGSVSGFSAADERKLLRKIDLRLVPWLSLLYLLSFLDRSAISNAQVYGLSKSIGASDQEYRWGLSVFFFPYAFAEVPSNIFLKRFRPSVWLPFLIISWSICMTMQGVVKSPGGLYATRFCLGLCEGGLFPGVQYLLSCWYKRSEFGLRCAIFFSAATAAGAFGSLLSVALAQMDGIGGYAGWRWIFIIEGLITFIAGLLSFFLVQDFPDTAKFLSSEERSFVIGRLQGDDQFSAGGESFSWKYVRAALKDPKMYLSAIIYGCVAMPLYAFSLFGPTIVQNLGFTKPAVANLVTAPIYIVACFFTIGIGYTADRTGGRAYYNLALLALGAVGYVILIASRSFALSYVATYIVAACVCPLIANSIAWPGNNTEGTYKRAVVLGLVIGWGNLNGVVSSNVYWSNMKPWYRIGHALCLAYLCIGFVASAVLLWLLKRENRRRDAGLADEIIGGNAPSPQGRAGAGGWYRTVEDARRAKGDRWSGFRYRL